MATWTVPYTPPARNAIIFDDAAPLSAYVPPPRDAINFDDVPYPTLPFWYFLAPPFTNL